MYIEEKKYQEKKLIELLAADSEYAFQLIYDHYRDRIYMLAIDYLKSPVLAQEAVQDVFLKLWFARKNIRTDSPLEPWLLTVAKNHLLNQLKSIAHEWVKLTDEKELNQQLHDITADHLQLKEYKEKLSEALHTLSENQRKVFILSREEGLSYFQIGERLGISAQTVKTHLSRGLKSIREYLKKQDLMFLFCFV